jgi:hypothetical protein
MRCFSEGVESRKGHFPKGQGENFAQISGSLLPKIRNPEGWYGKIEEIS